MTSISPYSPRTLNQPHCGTRCQATFAANRDSATDTKDGPKNGATGKDWFAGGGLALAILGTAAYLLKVKPQALDDIGKTIIKFVKDGKTLFRDNLPEIKRRVDILAKKADETLFEGQPKAKQLVDSVRSKIRELGLDDLQTNKVEQWLHNFFKDAEKAAQGKTDVLDNVQNYAKSFWNNLLK